MIIEIRRYHGTGAARALMKRALVRGMGAQELLETLFKPAVEYLERRRTVDVGYMFPG